MAQAAAPRMTPQQANMAARGLIVGGAVKRTQQIYSKVIDVASENVLQIQPRNVGLILGFIVNIKTNVAVAASTGSALTVTPFGPANLLKNVSFFDLNNNTRINTTGWHLHLLNSARAQSPYLAARTNDTYPIDYGNNYPSLIQAGASIAQAANSDVAMTYFVPLAYSDQDLRGAVYANVVNATMNLQLTLNNAAVQARTLQGSSDAVYVTANGSTPVANVTVGNFTVEVYQVYYDQLPEGQNGVVLPLLDLSTVYELKNTAIPGIVANQDFPLPYSNFRDFLSTFAIYRNRPMTNNGFANESDIAYWALESANYTNVFKVAPKYAAAWGRQTVEDDFPLGVYYVPTRSKPISTVQYGNMNLVLNAADVQTDAAVLIGYEAFALVNIIGQAGSLAPG
jgi:hypothetical protein